MRSMRDGIQYKFGLNPLHKTNRQNRVAYRVVHAIQLEPEGHGIRFPTGKVLLNSCDTPPTTKPYPATSFRLLPPSDFQSNLPSIPSARLPWSISSPAAPFRRWAPPSLFPKRSGQISENLGFIVRSVSCCFISTGLDLIGRLFRSIAGWRWPRLASRPSTPWVCSFSLAPLPVNFFQFRLCFCFFVWSII